MKYIAHRRFKGRAICGQINIPAMTALESIDGVIMFGDKPLCFEQSENAHQFFARNDDGQGMERGNLTQEIQKRLRMRKNHQKRWDMVWEDQVCLKYKWDEHPDHFLWNHEWFLAPIEDLKYIAKLVKGV